MCIPCLNLTLTQSASELFAEFRGLVESDLESLRLVMSHRGRRLPTIGGPLLFGDDRRVRLCREARTARP